MSTVTSINEAKAQRTRDLNNEQMLITQEKQLEKSLEYVRERLREVRNRLGTNKPTGGDAA